MLWIITYVLSSLFVDLFFLFRFNRASGWRGANTPGGGRAGDLLPRVRIPVIPGEWPNAVWTVYSDRMYLDWYYKKTPFDRDLRDWRVVGLFLQVRFIWSFWTYIFLRLIFSLSYQSSNTSSTETGYPSINWNYYFFNFSKLLQSLEIARVCPERLNLAPILTWLNRAAGFYSKPTTTPGRNLHSLTIAEIPE